MISAIRRSSFAKSSKFIVVIPSIICLGSSDLLRFGFETSILLKSTGAFLILSVLNIFCIFSAESGMKGLRSFAICLMDSTN